MESLGDAEAGGLGWTLTLIDAIASEYGWDDEIIIAKPLARILAYFAAICIRHGNTPSGPTYEEEELIDDLNGATRNYE